LTSEDATALIYLRCLWDSAYAISLTDAIWVARRRDNTIRVLTADTAPELRWLLRADHGQRLRTGTCLRVFSNPG
jgi:hypothetical protein